ncbi:hypothetical protein AB0H83_37260 [Dactylosporangium sp. NPDC050688]|uniref:hypothetical protein n=1 Tax=Dactylosporangium sp. NPDC050688 TaxID=3157217 RepID=UPI0033F4B649
MALPVGTGWLLHHGRDRPDDALLAVLHRQLPETGSVWLAVQPPVRITADATVAVIGALLGGPPHDVTGVRLIGSGSAAPGPASPVGTLAARLGVDVLVPTGSLLFGPDGSLFVHGRAAGADWRRFRADGRHDDLGSRLPAPAWDGAARLAAASRLPAAAVAEEIPAGLWLRSVPQDQADLGDLAYAIPATGDRLRVLLGDAGTGHGRVPVDAVCALLRALPVAVRRQAELLPYGDPAGGPDLAAAVAAELGEPVLVGCGVPTVERSGARSRRWVSARGEPTWEPFGRLLRFQPGSAEPELVEAVPPVTGWPAAPGLSSWPLVPGWQVDALPGGLWVRGAPALRTAGPPECTAVDPDRVVVVVGAPDVAVPSAVWSAVAALLSRLPVPARQRARVVVPQPALGGPDLAVLAGWPVETLRS